MHFEPGRVAVVVGLVTSILSAVCYLAALRSARLKPLARLSLWLTAAASVFVFFRLMHLVATKQFAFRYVFDYVSADLNGAFLYSATWAGQEGSFALWAAWTGVIGVLLAWKARDWEARIMPTYLSALVALFAVMIWLSPFATMVRETGPRPGDLPPGLPWPPPWPPQDGNGLNPSLQNYWMAIHPPTIFLGFASLAAPFAYAVAALAFRQYAAWSARVMPWVLLSVATLGLGLFMGGYWAYETQGWHGFWAWDPVENASLFPWLCAIALSHGLVVQRVRGRMTRTNLFLAVAAWLLFVYGTFLTRSGVLANFSVHAFGMLDNAALQILLWLIAAHGVLGLGLLLFRWRSIPSASGGESALSLDTMMAAAVALMVAAAAVICIGTSWPMISRLGVLAKVPFLAGLYAESGTRVEPIFYNRVGVVLVLPSLLVLGLAPLMAWGKTNGDVMMRKLMAPWLLAVATGVGILAFVLHEAGRGVETDTPRVVTVAIGTLGTFVFLANLGPLRRVMLRKPSSVGGWLAHMGVGLILVGAVISNVYEHTDNHTIVEGQGPVPTRFGYSLQFAGWSHEGKPDDEVLREWRRHDHAALLKVAPTPGSSLKTYEARVAVFKYWNSGNEEWATMTWPDIRKQWHRDIYLAAADEPRLVRPSATLSPGETSTIGLPGLGPTGYEVKYERFYRDGPMGETGGVMGAEMTLKTPDGKAIRIRPGLRFDGGGQPAPTNISIPSLDGAVILQGGIRAEDKRVTVAFELPKSPATWVVPIAATNKPMINLVWIGVLMLTVGSVVAMVRRSLEPAPQAA